MMPVRYLLIVLTSLLFFTATAQTFTFNTTNSTCNGSSDGFIDLTVTGGTPPFSYLWSNNSTTEDISNLSSGTYSVTITDGLAVTVTGSATVLEPGAWELNTTVTDVRCTGESNGSITLSVNGGTAPYSYKWTGGPTSQNLNGCAAGVYTVTVTDNNGCTATTSATVQQTLPLTWAAGTTNPTCSGMANGLIDLNTYNGTAPYNFYWSNGSTSEDQNGLTSGTYSVTILDANACRLSTTFSMQNLQSLNIVPTLVRPTCGNNDGMVSLSVSGGMPPYIYNWSNGTTTAVVSGLASGTYTVTVMDTGGCTNTATVAVTPMDVQIIPTFAQCAYSLTAYANFGAAPYTYLWSTGSTTYFINGQAPGFYSLTVTDATGCTTIATVDLAPPAPLIAGIEKMEDVCTGGLYAYGINFTPVSYIWSSGGQSAKISNIPAGTYTVTLTAVTGCTVSAAITTDEALSSATFTLNLASTQPTCLSNLGSISLVNPSSNAPPLSFLWSNGATTEGISNLDLGTYTVTVSNANGCTSSVSRLIVAPIQTSITQVHITPSDCSGLGAINITPSIGNFPLTYLWSNGSAVQNLLNVAAGTYSVTVTGANGCSTTEQYIVPAGPQFNAQVTVLSNNCNSATLQTIITGAGAGGPFIFTWTGPNGFTSTLQFPVVFASGTYSVTVTSLDGCQSTTSYYISVNEGGACGSITGNIIYDLDNNCAADPGEQGLAGWLLRAVSATHTIYGTTGLLGDFLINVPAGDYVLEVLPPNGLWQICPDIPVASGTADNTFSVGDILVQGEYPCPALEVSIATSFLRRCFNGTYHVNYCNMGTTVATDAYVLVTLDPFLTPASSNAPYSDLGNGVLRFDIGSLNVGQCGSFFLQVNVSCDAVLGQTHCTEAHIYPEGSCEPVNTAWSGASLRLTSQCNPDSVRFIIKNIGIGDMQSTSDYIVVEDAVMLLQAPFQLASGDSTIVGFPANGSTWRVEVGQVPFHPGMSAPALSVEACTTGTSFSTGYVTQFANNEADPWIDIDCTANVGSYDPNDKQGFPIGYGTEHYIRPGTELEYLIRFQNTGTDTAFTVRVVDTLSSLLDPATIRPGVSSHPYTFNLSGEGIAEFLFDNILLPDSSTNQLGSNGLVKFSIRPRVDAPLETLIENSASIFFDFNEPVITNTTRHKLSDHFLTVGLWQPQRPEYQVLVSPNPFSETALLEVRGLESSQPVHLQIIDLQGHIVQDETTAGPVLTLKKSGLPTGMYLFKLDQKGVLIGSGKLVVKE